MLLLAVARSGVNRHKAVYILGIVFIKTHQGTSAMKLNFAGPVVVVAVALYTVTSLAAECRVAIPYYPQGKIETPYSGGCKGGMADGTGKYSFSVVDKDTNTTVVTKVSGTFSNGKINGEGRLVSSNGSWEVGTYQEGNRWNITSVGFTKGVRFGTIFRDGKQVALCREDIEQPRCPPPASE